MSNAADPPGDRTPRVVVIDADEGEWARFVRAVKRQGFDMGPAALSQEAIAALGLGRSPTVFICARRGSIARRPDAGDAPITAPPVPARPSPLSTGIAHEISNPLTAVLANLELALRTMETVRSPEPWLGELRAEIEDAHEAARHVRQLVRPAKAAGRGDEEEARALDVTEVIEVSLRLAGSGVRSRARLIKDWGAVPRVVSTALRLGQVFLNLLVNAAQAIEAGGPGEHEIRIATRTDARGWASIAISDSGVGIPAEDLDRVFTPFFTTKPPEVGSGLGLPICQRIVEELGGRIEITSQPGLGTTVTVLLPPAPGPG